jgi:hypothetical protein
MVQQAQREDNIPSAHFDEKLDRIESLLKRLVENGSSSTSAATPLVIMASQSSGSKNQAIGIANSASIGEGSPSDSFPSNVIVSRRICTTYANTSSQTIIPESFNHVSKTTPQIAGNRKSLRRSVEASPTCFLRSMMQT